MDEHLPASSDKKLSYGTLILGMIINGLGYTSQPLHMYPEYMKDKPLERLIGEGVKAEDFNQHSIGRALDKIYEFGVSDLFSGFAEKTCKILGLKVDSLHLDSTSFHVDGKSYEDASESTKVIKLKQGYSRDHRPDLNQVILNLVVENQAGIPMFLQACSGNTSDKSNFQYILKHHMVSLKDALGNRYMVGDSAMYTPESLAAIKEAGGYFVTRVPGILNMSKELELTGRVSMSELEDGYWSKEIRTTYAKVEQRWLLFFSEQAFKREEITLKKQLLKVTEKESKAFWHLTNQSFACEVDARNMYEKFCKKCKYLEVADMKIIKKACYSKGGKPCKEQEPERFEYYIEGQSFTSLDKRDQALAEKGFFILATNDLDESFSNKDILSTYKSQQSVERGFRFLKSPEFMTSSFYLKKPERIEALLMIMTLCLLIYSALEYKIRKNLKECAENFKDQKNKDTKRPTARWVFFCFYGISIVSISGCERVITNLLPRHSIILKILGKEYLKIYSKNETADNSTFN
jgi:transposase